MEKTINTIANMNLKKKYLKVVLYKFEVKHMYISSLSIIIVASPIQNFLNIIILIEFQTFDPLLINFRTFDPLPQEG